MTKDEIIKKLESKGIITIIAGEYILTSSKLQVGHPPGAPLFQMLGAFFAMFTSDVTEIAKMMNLR